MEERNSKKKKNSFLLSEEFIVIKQVYIMFRCFTLLIVHNTDDLFN